MVRSRFGSCESQVQLHALNQRARQKDNSDLLRKVELRRRLCQEVKRANIFLAGAGFGQMFRHAWREKAGYTLALDTNRRKMDELCFHFPDVDGRVADFNTFTDWPAKRPFQVVDFDAFGDLYPGILHFFANAPWQTPLYVVVGDAGPLAFKRMGHITSQLRRRRTGTCYWGPRDLDTYMERLVWPWWEKIAKRHGLDITCRAWLGNREKTLAYYALKFNTPH